MRMECATEVVQRKKFTDIPLASAKCGCKLNQQMSPVRCWHCIQSNQTENRGSVSEQRERETDNTVFYALLHEICCDLLKPIEACAGKSF